MSLVVSAPAGRKFTFRLIMDHLVKSDLVKIVQPSEDDGEEGTKAKLARAIVCYCPSCVKKDGNHPQPINTFRLATCGRKIYSFGLNCEVGEEYQVVEKEPSHDWVAEYFLATFDSSLIVPNTNGSPRPARDKANGIRPSGSAKRMPSRQPSR